jgi:hypothetical protein
VRGGERERGRDTRGDRRGQRERGHEERRNKNRILRRRKTLTTMNIDNNEY